jgi:hypothetical protein
MMNSIQELCMAGGPHAAVVMCLHCGGKANRMSEGLENDWYLCESCEKKFGVHWDDGPPAAPQWPPTAEQLEHLRQLHQLKKK